MKPLRTLAFAPGSDGRKLEKARDLPADALIFDLEDAVAPAEKERARALVREALLQPRRGRGLVRVNALSTGLLAQDLETILCSRLDGVVVPKAESAEELCQVDSLLREGEKRRGLPAGGIELIPLVESAAGVYFATEIAGACSRVARLCFGAIDFTLDIGAQWDASGAALLHARSALVIASRVAGVEAPIDTVFPDLKDDAGLAADAQLARRLGFQGKLVIHPRQIAVVNEE